MRPSKTIDEEVTEETEINKTEDINNLDFIGIEVTGTPGKLYIDQNVRFPVIYRKGTKYVFMLYFYDANAIITEPLKYRTVK